MKARTLALLLGLVVAGPGQAADKLKAMVLTGQNNHGWEALSAQYEAILVETGLFDVDMVLSPPTGGDMSKFKPDFDAYDVVVLDYNGDYWSKETQKSLEDYLRNGGGLVFGHAVNHTFADWDEFNEMMGSGAWGGRDERHGPYVHYRDGKITFDDRPGHAGECIDAHEYVVPTRELGHPIMHGLPAGWLHGTDELYSNQRGHARNMTVLATAYSDPKREAHWGVMSHGTGEHEPMAFTVRYGKGRVFGTPMGLGAVFASLFFAFGHSLVTFQWWHFATFFPGLVFAWMR